MRSIIRHQVFLVFLFVTILFSSCGAPSKPTRIYLDKWKYSIDGKFLHPLPAKTLGNLVSLIPEGRGFITLYTEFDVPWQMMSGDVGLALGSISVSSKIYLNGKEISSTGNFPPKAFDGGKAYTNIRLSPQLLNLEKNILEMVIWVDGTGGVSGRPFVNSFEDTSYYVNDTNIRVSKINMIFSWSCILTGIVYLLFYVQQKKERQYRDYAFMSLWTSLYLVPQWTSEIPNVIGAVPYLWWIKVLNGAVAVVVCYYATSFARSFLGISTGKKMRIWRLALMWVGIVVVLLTPSLVFFYRNMWILILILVLELLFAFSALKEGYKIKKSNYLKLVIGFSPVIISVVADLIIKVVIGNQMAPYITLYGWQLTTITFIAIVTNRYSKIRNQFEYLNENLEKEVQQRTNELTIANEELERRHFEAARDMELAVHVQKSFYPEIPNFKGWDIGLSFNPLSGVSGDLYDFYVVDGQLRGFGLFDVSGHGISSGLVTMLSKNVIFHAFRSTLNISLDKAVEIVNDQVIQIKGDIENYLTGCMFRIDEKNPAALEFVNAGAPYPLYKAFSESEASYLAPSNDSPQYGMIGVRDLDVKFQVLKKEMKANDILVLYTDGLTETENENGEPFGKDRLQKLLGEKRIIEGSSAEYIAGMLFNEIKKFAGSNPLDDDITILVLKRTGDQSVVGEEELLELEGI